MRYVDTLTLTLDYRMVDATEVDLVWRLTPAGPDSHAGNDVATTRVALRRSMARLQALIDAASDGDAVLLPPGTYTGTLHGRARTLDVRGAEGAERTVLVSVDRDAPILTVTGARSTWSNIDWRTTGAPLAFPYGSDTTISHSTIEPVPGMAHDVEELLPRWGNSRLYANRIADFGTGEAARCSALVTAGQGGYTGGSTYLQHNLFLDNDCDALVRFGEDDVPVRSHLTANNNTFVGSPTIVRVSALGTEADVLRFRNNVVVRADAVVELPESRFRTTARAWSEPAFVSSRNVVWNSAVQSAVQADWLSRPGIAVEGTDLLVEPKFVDPANGDYRLRPDSALIDAGVEPDEYVWDNYGRSPDSAPDGLVPPPIDGDGDGEAEHDIGAFEHAP